MKEIWLAIAAIGMCALVMLVGTVFSIVVFADYWKGTARASLIKKQTGIEYTWREAAQIQNMYDQNNVRIIFSGEEKEATNAKQRRDAEILSQNMVK